ncbi:MAG: protein kinase, partial [Oscillospiraceae bacterium]|nr:protein kinase [Oscillospiraceae bacterium]
MKEMIKCMGCMKDYPKQRQVCPYCGYPQNTDGVHTAFQRPRTILSDRYVIGKAFHRDSIGISYIGWDNLIEKKVVIKEYFPEHIAFRIDGQEIVSEPKWEKLYETGKREFLKEIENWSYLGKNSRVAKVYDQTEQYGTAYYIREYVKGQTLRQVLEQENPILFGQARHWMRQLIQILRELWQYGFVHGNLSIDSIVVSEDEMKLINFGIHSVESKAKGSVLDRNPYIPPELYEENDRFWQKADIYASAAVFYRMVTGEPVCFADRKG